MNDALATVRPLLIYGVLPLWILSGLLDWWCHRRTDIAHTGGVGENLFHWLMFFLMGAGVMAAVLLQTNAALVLLGLALFVAHEAVVYLELRFALPLRRVGALEQMVHSFQEILPLLGLFLLATTIAPGSAGWQDLALRWRDEPVPPRMLAALFFAVGVCNFLPLFEELLRCVRARPRPRPVGSGSLVSHELGSKRR
ncbi:MAG: hypothetical protein V4731_03450 [Pseudomonadota bacterium]